MHCFIGNQHADALAKAAFQQHSPWTNELVNRATSCVNSFCIIGNLVARTLAAWIQKAPDSNVTRSTKLAPRRKPQPRDQQQQQGVAHTFFGGVGREWRCCACGLQVSKLTSRHARAPCKGKTLFLQQVLAADQGHRLAIKEFEQGSGFIIFCVRCGAWATSAPKLYRLIRLNIFAYTPPRPHVRRQYVSPCMESKASWAHWLPMLHIERRK